ncbi:MAG: DUF455 domain-containing protein, partial [Alphaproteobacteria bacterium]|nr:DUF455 domain-containing protein [Alphaproteobacteria bacterium]
MTSLTAAAVAVLREPRPSGKIGLTREAAAAWRDGR